VPGLSLFCLFIVLWVIVLGAVVVVYGGSGAVDYGDFGALYL